MPLVDGGAELIAWSASEFTKDGTRQQSYKPLLKKPIIAPWQPRR